MAKIELDKYYTPIETANYCWELIEKTIDLKDVTEIIEPSCGNGSFYNWKRKPDLGIDIKPEMSGENIKTADFLSYPMEYKKGRLIIGNPPYGDKLSLALQFYNKSVDIADYIGFVLPINQLNCSQAFYKFDLICSEPLGEKEYSGIPLRCCFNIYRRPKNGLNTKKSNTIEGVNFYRQDSKGYYELEDYDVRMCYWGNGSAGKILSKDDKYYAGEYKIKVNDNNPHKDKIIKVLKTFDWKGYLDNISMKRLKVFQIKDVLRKEIPELSEKKVSCIGFKF